MVVVVVVVVGGVRNERYFIQLGDEFDRKLFLSCLCQLFILCKILNFNTLLIESQMLKSLKLYKARPDFVGLASL